MQSKNLLQFVMLRLQIWSLIVRFFTGCDSYRVPCVYWVSPGQRLLPVSQLCKDWELTLSEMEGRESGLNPMCGGAAGR